MKRKPVDTTDEISTNEGVITKTTIINISNSNNKIKIKKNKKQKYRESLLKLQEQSYLIVKNIFNINKKLIIFDLNNVLIHRANVLQSSRFFIRPYLNDFLLSLKERYWIAIWTSMRNKTTRRIVKKLLEYLDKSITFLFIWNQSKCRICKHDILDNTIDNNTIDNKTIDGNTIDIINISNTQTKDLTVDIPDNDIIPSYKDDDRLNSIIDMNTNRIIQNNMNNNTTNNSNVSSNQYHNNNVKNNIHNLANKPIYLKDISMVTKEYPYFTYDNMLLIDDNKEKCKLNPIYTCINPKPFVMLKQYYNKDDNINDNEEYDNESIDSSDDDIIKNDILLNCNDTINNNDYHNSNTNNNINHHNNHNVDSNHIHDNNNVKNDDEFSTDNYLYKYLDNLSKYDGKIQDFYHSFGTCHKVN